MKKEWVSNLASGLLIILFLYTGITKLWDHSEFIYTLHSSPWALLNKTASFTAWLFPLLEILTAGLLAMPKLRLWGFALSVLLMAVLSGYVLILVVSHINLPCSCGGIIQQLSWTQHIYFNLGFLFLAVWGLINERTRIDNQYVGTSILT